MENSLAMNCLRPVTFVNLPQYLYQLSCTRARVSLHNINIVQLTISPTLDRIVILVNKCEGENYKRGCCGREGFCSFFLQYCFFRSKALRIWLCRKTRRRGGEILGKQKKKHLNSSLGK